MAVEKLILFHINQQVYGINVESVSAIESNTDIVFVPNAPCNIEGIINLRGEVIPVYSLHRKFNLPVNRTQAGSQLIITKSGNEMFAFVVDAVDEIHVVEDGELLGTPDVLQSNETSYIDAIANVDNKLVLCVDVNELISEAEKKTMKTLVDQLTNKE